MGKNVLRAAKKEIPLSGRRPNWTEDLQKRVLLRVMLVYVYVVFFFFFRTTPTGPFRPSQVDKGVNARNVVNSAAL